MRIKIFFFISDFSFGGAGNAVLNFLKNLRKDKYEIYIIFLGNSDYTKYIPKNVKVIKIKSDFFLFKTFFSFFKLKKIIKKEIGINQNNLFISNIHYSNILTILFLRKLDSLKIFLFERTSIKELDIFLSTLSFIKNKIIKFLIKKLYVLANLVIANSLTGKKEFLEIGIKAKTIYSGSINKILPNKKFKKKIFYKLISVGRLTKQKNYELLIKSIGLIKNNKFKLFIYGNGNLHNKLKKIISNNHLNKKIKLMSHVKDKNKIYSNADLLIHTSLFEGLPNCIVEAINYGVPVIACKGVGATSEILGNGKYGKILKKNDKYEISKNIEIYLKNPKILQNKILKSKRILYQFKDIKTAKTLEKEIIRIFN